MAASKLDAGSLAEARDQVATRIAALSPEERGRLDRGLAIDAGERFAYQQAQAAAHAGGRIATRTAAYLYRAIGEGGSPANGGWPIATTLADKVIVTQAIAELVGAR